MPADKWERIKTLAEGGQGQVFIVKRSDGSDPRHYVQKRLKNQQRIGRFRQEAEIGLKLAPHPHVLQVVEFELDGKEPFIISEYCEGGDLSRSWAPKGLSRESVLAALRMFRQIVDGVAHAHKEGVIHRDLKPANIFLRNDGITPVVGDFGLCLVEGPSDRERHTGTGEVVGPRAFLSPEVEAERSEVTPAADVYSLGKILFWLISGRVLPREMHRDAQHRFGPHDPVQLLLKHAIPTNTHLQLVYELFDSTITENPNDRISSAHQLGAEIDILIGRIQQNAHVIDIETPQHCTYCGLGYYRVVRNFSAEDWPMQGGLLKSELGVHSESRNAWCAMSCARCGHVVMFRPRPPFEAAWLPKKASR